MTGKAKIPLAAGALALFGIAVYAIFLFDWSGLTMSVDPTRLVNLLAPIAFAAAVIERGVEILISPWRDAGASKLEGDLAAVKARSGGTAAAAQVDSASLKAASDAVDEYRGETQQYAFAISLALSTLVGMAGIRALQPFLSDASAHLLEVSKTQQRSFFHCVDIGLTATLLSGGASGVHSVINAATSFFDASADKSTKAVAG